MYKAVLTILIVLALLSASGFGAPAATYERLDNGWEYYQGDLGGTWELWRGAAASDNVKWIPVELPHCFNARDAVDPDAPYYQGPGWYRAQLDVKNPYKNGRTLLVFEGAGQKTVVFVGLEQIGQQHIGGYDAFTIDITGAVAKVEKDKRFKGKVPVAVRCDNCRDLEMMPSDLSDFVVYGGLYRHVHLKYVPAISIERVHIDPSIDADGKATAKICVRLSNPQSLDDVVALQITARGPGGETIQNLDKPQKPWQGEKEIASIEFAVPKLWSPDEPNLYECTVLLRSAHGVQEVHERFGFRTFEFVKHGPFKLNGERLLLRGTHFHQDHAGLGAAVPDDVTLKTLRMIKDVGANFVRLGHYPQSKLVLDQCDELGLLVWEEIPWCRGGLGGARFQRQGRNSLHAMIDQHFNHPAVILWGLGNENDWPGDFESFDKDAIRTYMSELNRLAHELDPSRMTTIRRCDFCKDIVDVYSPSIWAGWYRGQYTEYRASAEAEIADVDRFFHAEWGGDSHAHRHSEDLDKVLARIATGNGTDERDLDYQLKSGIARVSNDGDWSESYICNLFDWHLKEQETMPNLTGSAQWIFKDFATPLRPENPIPRVNQKGLVERDLTPKEAYYVFQSYWTTKPMIHIYGHSWPIRWGEVDEPKMVKVYSNCPEVELFVNDQSAGVRKRDSQNYPAAGLRWLTPLCPGQNTLRAVGRQDRIDVEDVITFEFETEKWGQPTELTLDVIKFDGGKATLEACLLDDDGVRCLNARNVVRFGVAGDGRLLDNLGTTHGSRVVQLANGVAQIGVELTGEKAVASVSSKGIPTAFVDVTAAAALSVAVNPKRFEALDVAAIDRERILKAAKAALNAKTVTITSHRAKHSAGGPHDFYSNGDYWWPDPKKPDGLPYVKRDGESNPDNFSYHRLALRSLRDSVAALAAAYEITGDDRYAAKAADLLRAFFLNPETRMNPHLEYSQAVPGRETGRSYGIIDALHLAEVPRAILAVENSPKFPAEVRTGLRDWFRDFMDWLTTSEFGQQEANTQNNHAVAYCVQLASYADYLNDEEKLAECRRRFKEVFVPKQMAADGSFPQELARTKPYGYSIFQLDNMAILCQLLSTPDDNLWQFTHADGRGMKKAMAYLYPYLADKSQWPLSPDVQAWKGWPARQPCLLFAGVEFHDPDYLDLWQRLEADPTDAEVRRNIAVTQPILWLK